MISNELLGFVTNVRTVPGRIAKWHSTQVYVRVSICSDDIKETCEWIARILAECSGSWAASFGVAHNELNDKSGYSKESIEKRATDDTAPISAKKSHHGGKSRSLTLPIPIDCVSRNTEVNLINKDLHASLRNCRPQISSMRFKKLRTPALA